MLAFGLELLFLYVVVRIILLLLGIVFRLIEIVLVLLLILWAAEHYGNAPESRHYNQYRYGGTANFHIATTYTH
jgi:hypothetical protein